jgi:hypothetical protein
LTSNNNRGAVLLRQNSRTYFVIFLWCAGVTVLTHCPMVFHRHAEGDELVYYVLSERMGWDLSNFTTRDDPRVNGFPYTVYRGPLFHHPPLLALVLKAGSHFTANPLLLLPGVATPPAKSGTLPSIVPGECVAAAFLFDVFVCVAALWYAWRFLALLEIEPQYGAAALIGITLCPLVLFSTVRLHHDGLLGLMLLCGLVAFAESLERRRIRPAVEAAVWLVAAMNVRFNAIVALPVIMLLPLYWFARQSRSTLVPGREAGGGSPSIGRTWPRWLAPAIVLGAVLTAGMQHYYRLFAVYGSLLPGAIIQPIGDVAKRSSFLAMTERVDRWWVCWELAAMFPLAVLFMAPWNLRQFVRDLRGGSWSAAFVAIFGFLFATQLGLSYKQVRYFAAVTPLMYLCWPYLLRNKPQSDWLASSTWGVAGLTLLLMVTTGFLNATLHAPDQAAVIPSLTFYWPPFLQGYRPHR